MIKSLVYGTVDFCTGGRGIKRRISGESIRFPPRWSRYYPATYEPEKFAFLRRHCQTGDIVMDIGAHIGLFSVLMARRVGETGRVYSFEPTPLTREVLRQTVALNNCEKIVEVCEEAVKDKTGTFSFYDTGDPISNANSLICTERSKHEVMVKTVSLDDFTERRGVSISCLKIDAEGAELDILRGARNTFLTSRPAVQIEVHPHAIAQAGGTLREVWDLLRSYRMSVFYADSPVTDEWFCGLADGVELQVLPEEYSVSQGR